MSGFLGVGISLLSTTRRQYKAATALAVDATAEAIRATMLDPSSYASGGWPLPGSGGARVNAAARASAAMQQRIDGVWEFAPHNLLPNSSGAAGTNNVGTVDNGIVAITPPAGLESQPVRSLTFASTGEYRWGSSSGGVPGAQYSGGIWVRTASGTASLVFDTNDGPTTALTATTTWQFVSATAAGTANAWQFFDVSQQSVGGAVLYVCAPRIVFGASAATYVPTFGAVTYAPAIDWLSGIGAYGLRAEETRTNLALWSRDLTQTAWVKTGATAALTATGIDGVANAASTVTATAANGTVLQTITAASAARTLTLFLRRRTGTGGVDITIDGGTTWTPVTLTGAWQRFTRSATVLNPSIGVRLQASGDAIDVDVAQCEDGTLATSPILTYGATATRAQDQVNATYNANGSGTVVVDVFPLQAGANNGVVSLNDGTGSNRVDVRVSGQALVTVGGVNQAVLTGTNFVASSLQRVAVAYAPNDFSLVRAGGAATTSSSGTVPSTTRIDIGGLDPGVPVALNGWVTRVRHSRARLPDSTLQALTT